MPLTRLLSCTVVLFAIIVWIAPLELRAQNDVPDNNDNDNNGEEPPPANDDDDTNDEDEDLWGDNDLDNDVPAAPRAEPDDERWQRFAGPYFNRAPVRNYVGAMARWSAQIDGPVAFGQISFEFWTELSPFEIADVPLSLIAHWGISIGYSDGEASFLQTLQPIYLGAKFNVLSEEEYHFSAATMFGFLDDTVAGEYNPMNLLPGLRDFYWDIRGMFSYALPDVDFAFNTEMVLHFNFGFATNKVSFSWLLEAVFMLSPEFVLRGGFDFHTVVSGVNLHIQGDFWFGDTFMVFAQFKGFLSGDGRVFDFALMAGATVHF